MDTEEHRSTRGTFHSTHLSIATPEANKLFQHPGVRERFSAAADTYREFIIKGGTLFAQRNGRVPVTVGEMEDFIEPAYQLARALDEAARSGATTSRSG